VLPDWLLLTQSWVEKRHGVNGVTLPFLVGALAYRDGKERPTLADARALLDEMKAHPIATHVVEVQRCGDLGVAVLKAAPAPSQYSPVVGFRSPSGQGFCLVFGPNFTSFWGSPKPEELLERLLDESKLPIEKRTFSRERYPQAWRAFKPWEVAFIRETIPTLSAKPEHL
jgi:hypothetical protein